MKSMRQNLVYLMGIVILVAALYWTYLGYYSTITRVLGIVIIIADLVWLYLDSPMGMK